MFKAVRSFYKHDKGWIINLSGNSMFREIEFQGDDSVKYVGIFHQTCCDEVQILGVRFSETDYGTCAPYKIVVDDHWAFSGLSVHKGNVFGQESLNRHTAKDSDEYDPGRPGLGYELSGTGASGWETDKVAKSSPKDIRIIAKGLNSDGGADMVIREPKGARGGLFSASSIVFGGCLLIDETASGIVRNVINRALGKPSGNNE